MDFVTEDAAALGECPLWDDRDDAMLWIDIEGRRLFRLDLASGSVETKQTKGRPGSIALSADSDRLLLAVEHEVGWFSWANGAFDPWVELEVPGTGNRLNDGRCDPAGRFWVGSMYEDVEAVRFDGSLHRVEPSGSVATTLTSIGISNGLAFSPDGATMYFADTLRRTVWAYDYDVGSGVASGQRIFTDFSGLPGNPDGACVDVDGCYWVACVFGGAVALYVWVVVRPTDLVIGGWIATLVAAVWIGSKVAREIVYGVMRFRNAHAVEAMPPDTAGEGPTG